MTPEQAGVVLKAVVETWADTHREPGGHLPFEERLRDFYVWLRRSFRCVAEEKK